MVPRRIVFHTASLRGGGAERVFVLIANEMAARGHDVTLFTWNGQGPNGALRSPAVKLIDLGIPVRNEGFGKPATLRGLRGSIRMLRQVRPDVVYSAPEFANLLMAVALILSGSRARFYPSFHAAASLPTKEIGSRLAVILSVLTIHRASKAIAVSNGVGRDIAARGVPASKVAVINNPLTGGLDQPGGPYVWQRDLAERGEGPVIASAGWMVPVKDHRTLLAAFAKLRAVRPARLIIFGYGPLEADLKAYAAELGISNSVLFPGYVEDPRACYAAADLFVLSSRSEGFGNVLIEAMSAGVPVVSTDAPHGPREILADGRFGLLVPVGDAAALAVAMATTLDHPLSFETLKARAADFAVETIGDKYEALVA
jgi:glycosyltransferase involved in cell wall biosynthesis